MRVSGRMANVMGWAWRHAAAGCTGANGRRGTRDDTESAKVPPATPNTRAPGLTDSKTDMAPKHTPMAVRCFLY